MLGNLCALTLETSMMIKKGFILASLQILASYSVDILGKRFVLYWSNEAQYGVFYPQIPFLHERNLQLPVCLNVMIDYPMLVRFDPVGRENLHFQQRRDEP